MKIRRCVSLGFVGCLIASPASAADLRHTFVAGQPGGGPSPYIGVTISFVGSPNGNGTKLASGIGLDAGVRHKIPGRMASAGPASRMPLIELRAGVDGTDLRLRGRSIAAAADGGGLSAGEISLAILAAGGAALLVSEIINSDDDGNEDERCQIEPWLCD